MEDLMLRCSSFIVGLSAFALLVGCGSSSPSTGGTAGASAGGAAAGSNGAQSGASGTGTSGSNGGSAGNGTGGANVVSGGAGVAGAGTNTAGGAAGSSGSAGSVSGASGGTAGTGSSGAPGGGAAGSSGGSSLGFFVTSTGSGAMGGNLGGLAGADAKCQMLAMAVGAGARTWHAYLSLSGATPVNARDRIGMGPWFNSKGVKIADNLAILHDEGGMNALGPTTSLDEMGNMVPVANPNQHDILTGSGIDGHALPAAPDLTCAGWTSNAASVMAQVGHENRTGTGGNPPTSWNSAHSAVCTMAGLAQVGGAGRLYCFAIN